MNKKFILILFVIFVIGIITYKYKKNELFEPQDTREISLDDIAPTYDFIKSSSNSGGLFKNLYSIEQSYGSDGKNRFLNTDFNNNYDLMIAKFLNGREQINDWINSTVLPDFSPYMYFSIYKKYSFSFTGSPSYFNCTLNKSDDSKFLEIIFNLNEFKDNPNSILTINHNVETSSVQNFNYNKLNKLEIYINTVKNKFSNGSYVIENFYNITFNDTLISRIKLKDGIENHFLMDLKHITYSCSDENVTAKMNSSVNLNIYSKKLPAVIESTRTPLKDGKTGFEDIICGNGASCFAARMSQLNIKRPIIQNEYYALGDYFNLPSWNRGIEDALLVKKKENIVIPVETLTRKWYSHGCRWCNGKPMMLYSNNNIKRKVPVITSLTTKEDKDMNFLAIGDYAETAWNVNTKASQNHPHVLIREDYLEATSSGPSPVFDDRGSRAHEDLRVWTYFTNTNDQRKGQPGRMLALFIYGWHDNAINEQYPNGIRNRIIKESALTPQHMMDLNQKEINTIQGFFTSSSGFMNVIKPIEEKFENITSYYNKIKENKTSDSNMNPLESAYQSASKRRNQQINENVKNSEDNYNSITKYNLQMNQQQKENNDFYNFMDDVSKQLSEQRARERSMVGSELDALKNKVTEKDGLQSMINDANKTSLVVDSSLNLLGSNMVEQVRQYSLQKDNEKVLLSFSPQVLL